MAFKTPGVYVQEISLLPPSVAEVETAVPAFIGYTEKATRRGEDLTQKPTKISSLLEYHELFGSAYSIDAVDVEVDENNNYAVTAVDISTRFYLYDSLRLFFDNGGGDCYIVSVGGYGTVGSADLTAGLQAVEKVDEPTILLFPDATRLASTDESQFYTLQQLSLAQCARLQDRVAVFDLFEGDVDRQHDTSVQSFRDGVGINNLKYGAAYTPWLVTTYPRTVSFSLFRNNVDDSGGAIDLANLTSDSAQNALVAAAGTALDDAAAITASIAALRGPSPTLRDRYKTLRDAIHSGNDDATNNGNFDTLVQFVRGTASALAGWDASLQGGNLARDLDTYAGSTLKAPVTGLIAFERNADVAALTTAFTTEYDAYDATGWLDDPVANIAASGANYTGANDLETVQAMLADLDDIFKDATAGNLLSFISQVTDAAGTHSDMAQTLLYQEHSIIGNIVEHIKREMSRVPPSGAIAGAYAFVDNARGVWKAPANVSLSGVLGPVVPIDDADQEDLNVDSTAGKSVNAIRAFSGRGTVVWGARTLAGNDNEWRYVAVRRFFNMVEESVKKSTSWAVFEPNAAPVWTRIKSMIENFLIQKWREGALAGATPEEAFFVKVGLGQTMTAQDILEGRLNVEIGMAVVRPAEFIVLKFSHKLQES